jgi:archaellum component FlaC
MTHSKYLLEVPIKFANNQDIKAPLESAGIFLGIIVSGVAITNALINLISRFNKISVDIGHIQGDLQSYLKETSEINESCQRLDKKIDLHIQDYLHHKELTQMLVNQLNEKIDHKFNRINASVQTILNNNEDKK